MASQHISEGPELHRVKRHGVCFVLNEEFYIEQMAALNHRPEPAQAAAVLAEENTRAVLGGV